MISAVIEFENGRLSVHENEVKATSINFPPGFYEATTDERGNIVIERKKLPELHKPFHSIENTTILTTVENFFCEGTQSKVNQLGFIHKLGILAYGEAGCGKTSLFNYIGNELVDKNKAVVFFCNSGNSLGTATSLALKIRDIQKEPIVFIADEFERFAKSNEAEMKNLLDGKDSVENSLFLATTNYIDQIPKTIKERPSRFRLVCELKGIEDKETMYAITRSISEKISPNLFTEEEIVELFKEHDNTTLDKIKNYCLDRITNTLILGETKKKIGFVIPKIKTELEKKREEIDSRWVIVNNDDSMSDAKSAVSRALD